MIENRKRGTRWDRLSVQQQMFVKELLADDFCNASRAAEKAGYKAPAAAANKLLKNSKIKALLGKEKRLREERCDLRAEEVLLFLKRALFFNPLRYFLPSEDGGWAIEDPRKLPDEVGQLVDELEVKAIELPDGSKKVYYKVKLISKATALTLALKHVDTTQTDVLEKFDWDELYECARQEYNTIEAKIIEESESGSKRKRR